MVRIDISFHRNLRIKIDDFGESQNRFLPFFRIVLIFFSDERIEQTEIKAVHTEVILGLELDAIMSRSYTLARGKVFFIVFTRNQLQEILLL